MTKRQPSVTSPSTRPSPLNTYNSHRCPSTPTFYILSHTMATTPPLASSPVFSLRHAPASATNETRCFHSSSPSRISLSATNTAPRIYSLSARADAHANSLGTNLSKLTCFSPMQEPPEFRRRKSKHNPRIPRPSLLHSSRELPILAHRLNPPCPTRSATQIPNITASECRKTPCNKYAIVGSDCYHDNQSCFHFQVCIKHLISI